MQATGPEQEAALTATVCVFVCFSMAETERPAFFYLNNQSHKNTDCKSYRIFLLSFPLSSLMQSDKPFVSKGLVEEFKYIH